MSLAGIVIASHYAEPVGRSLNSQAILREEPSDSAEAVRDLAAGENFRLLDDSLGWAWGYAGGDGRVGYVRSEALGL